MPQKKTVEKAKTRLRQGKAPTTAAGEFVREEFEHVRKGKHGAKSPKQAVAIGLSKARGAGIPLPPPKKGTAGKAAGPGQKKRAAASPPAAKRAAARPATPSRRPGQKTASGQPKRTAAATPAAKASSARPANKSGRKPPR